MVALTVEQPRPALLREGEDGSADGRTIETSTVNGGDGSEDGRTTEHSTVKGRRGW